MLPRIGLLGARIQVTTFTPQMSRPSARANDGQIARKRFLQWSTMLAPQTVSGFRKIRIGSESDGGYVMLDDFEAVDLALSFGVDTNVDWDLAIAERGIAVQQFDHTVCASPVSHPLLGFRRKRVVGSRPMVSDVTIASILAEAGVARDASVILKCDIEGDEWFVLRHCAPEQLQRFSQIIIEFHDFARAIDEDWSQTALEVLSKLTAHFAVFHVHGNNWRPLISIGGELFPDVLEVSLASRSRYAFSASKELFPTPLDRPNDPVSPDLYLGDFRFGPAKPTRLGLFHRLQRARHARKFRKS